MAPSPHCANSRIHYGFDMVPGVIRRWAHIPAKPGIRLNPGCRIESGMTEWLISKMPDLSGPGKGKKTAQSLIL
jgi:hypothetical protein